MSESDFQGQESGSAMVLVAILMVAVIMLAALAMDTAAMAASKQEATHFAKYAALSALDAYTRTEGDHSAKMTAALTAANKIGGLNLTLLHTANGALEELSDQTSSDKPLLVPGRFYSEATQTCTADQLCGTGKTLPCFVKLSDVNADCDSVETVGPNAFQVKGDYATGLRRLFAGVFQNGPLSLGVDEVAALVPRHGCFVVDISRSMVRETHNATIAAPNGSYYSYQLTLDNGSIAPGYVGPHDAQWLKIDDDRQHPTTLPVPASSDPMYVRRHYKSDFQKVEVLKDSDYFNGNFDKHHPSPFEQVSLSGGGNEELWMSYARSDNTVYYRTDTYRDGVINGPEPLSTVLDGVKRALQIFKQRAVTGDRACIIFTDTALIWPRIFNLTSDFDYLLRFLDLRTPDSARSSDQATLAEINAMAIFPGHVTSSNIRLGVLEALRQFNVARNGDIPSVDFIVYAGDGIPNCTTCTSNDDPSCYPAGCGNTYYHYKQAIKELGDLAADTLYPSKISFSAIMTGGHVAPNTLNAASEDDPGTCLTDEQARIKNVNFVDGGTCSTDASCAASFLNMSDQTPFLRANSEMYSITRLTGGVWAPLRPYVAGSSCTATCSADSPTTQTTSCKPTGEQVEDYIEQIMGSNPFMIVPH